MAVTGVLRPGYVQLRVLDLEEAILHYRDRIGLNLVSVEGGRAFFQAFDEFDRHSIILCEGDTAGLDRMGFKVAKDADLDHSLNACSTAVCMLMSFPPVKIPVTDERSASILQPHMCLTYTQKWSCPKPDRRCVILMSG